MGAACRIHNLGGYEMKRVDIWFALSIAICLGAAGTTLTCGLATAIKSVWAHSAPEASIEKTGGTERNLATAAQTHANRIAALEKAVLLQGIRLTILEEKTRIPDVRPCIVTTCTLRVDAEKGE